MSAGMWLGYVSMFVLVAGICGLATLVCVWPGYFEVC